VIYSIWWFVYGQVSLKFKNKRK